MNLNVRVKGFKPCTNINDVVVPDALRKRIKTGVELFDDVFGGEGFVPSTVHMVSGGGGTGKSTLFRQIGDAITASGNIALYNSGEESVYQIKMSCERMGLQHGFLQAQEVLTKTLLKHADACIKANPDQQVFLLIDSLQTLDDGKYPNGATNTKTPTRCAEMLVDWAKRTNAIVFFINQCDKAGNFIGENKVKHAVDSHCHMYIDKSKKSPTYGERVMTIEKNRFGISGQSIVYGVKKEGLHFIGNADEFGEE